MEIWFNLLSLHLMNISKEIRRVSKQFREEHNITNWDINNGLCYDFAETIEEKIGGGDSGLVVLTSDMFLSMEDKDTIILLWGKRDLLEINGNIWSKKMLRLYGKPEGLERIDDLSAHGWVYYNGKHYDAECPRGVDYWYQLPIYKKFLKRKFGESK